MSLYDHPPLIVLHARLISRRLSQRRVHRHPNQGLKHSSIPGGLPPHSLWAQDQHASAWQKPRPLHTKSEREKSRKNNRQATRPAACFLYMKVTRQRVPTRNGNSLPEITYVPPYAGEMTRARPHRRTGYPQGSRTAQTGRRSAAPRPSPAHERGASPRKAHIKEKRTAQQA